MFFQVAARNKTADVLKHFVFCSDILGMDFFHVDISAGLPSQHHTKHPSNHRVGMTLRPGYIAWEAQGVVVCWSWELFSLEDGCFLFGL